MIQDIETVLSYIDPDESYDIWTKVGMALEHEGYDASVWDAWSSTGAKYRPGVCARKWSSFGKRQAGEPVTGGTIIALAKGRGYSPATMADDMSVFGWDDEVECYDIDRGYRLVDKSFVGAEAIPGPHNFDPVDDLIEYLSELFEPEDHVGYCDKLDQDKSGRWVPKHGIKGRTAGELIKLLKQGGFDAASITPESEGGALIRFNPLDGQGESDSAVTDYRYCLIESDTDSLEKQYAMLQAMNLPLKMLVYSGGKSLHAIVHVDAQTMYQYRQRVNAIYSFCKKQGFTPDEQDKNASRYSRMPGIKRGGKLQYIIASDMGPRSFREWEEWVEDENDVLPPITTLGDVWGDMPDLKPEIIGGLLREGHKLLISGPSKSGKSFLLMELAVCIASGTPWLDTFPCAQGKVLYLNLELDGASCDHRVGDIVEQMGIEVTLALLENFHMWNLRGRSCPLDKLTPKIIRRCKGQGYKMVIIDPIYKVITGDENDATEMSKFCSYFDQIADEVKCAVVYAHHHSKGAVGKYASAMDRASGSGVFARDPDAIIDIAQLKVPDDVADKYRDHTGSQSTSLSGWEVSFTLREFAPREDLKIWFDYPIHHADKLNFLAECKYDGTGQRGVGQGQTEKEDRGDMLVEAFRYCCLEDDCCTLADMAKYTGKTERTIFDYLKKSPVLRSATIEDGTKLVVEREATTWTFKGKKYSVLRVSSRHRFIPCE
jgi:RecA-family ATPase